MLQNDGVKADDESNKDGVIRGELRVESEALPQALDSETKWNAAGQSAVVIDDGRWACPRCTYINYSKSTRCSMCTAPLACDSTEAENCYQISSSKLENESAAQFRNPSPVPFSSCVEPIFRSSSSLDGFNVGENRNNFDQEAPICVNNPKGPQTMELIESVAISSQAKIDSASLEIYTYCLKGGSERLKTPPLLTPSSTAPTPTALFPPFTPLLTNPAPSPSAPKCTPIPFSSPPSVDIDEPPIFLEVEDPHC